MSVRGAVLWLAVALTVAACAASRKGGRCGGGRQGNDPMIRYTIRLVEPQTQMVDVTIEVGGVGTSTLDVAMPVWRPGKYAVLDQAGGVRGERAEGIDGQALPIRKIDKATWRIEAGGHATVRFSYRVFCNSLGDRTRHVDDTHAFISPAAVMAYVPGRIKEPVSVQIVAPAGWRATTSLEPVAGREGAFTAADYDELVDSPLEIGEHELLRFEVDGVPHDVAVWTGRKRRDGAADVIPDRAKLLADFEKIVREQKKIFGDLPYRRFVFILHFSSIAGGGTEHLNSFVAQGSAGALQDEKSYRGFMSLISHEMFHTWNVKRLRPADLTPYDYAHENYTRLLWLVEGTTSYYDDLCLVRAGLTPVDEYLSSMAGQIAGENDRPGAAEQSLEESSFDAWIKFNRSTPDAVNSQVNFYSRGAIVSMLLDLTVRDATGGAVSLDDVMRELYRRFPPGSGGYTTQDVLSTLREMTGRDFDQFAAKHLSGRERMDFSSVVRVAGLELVFEPEKEGDKEVGERAYVGMNLAERGARTVVQSVASDGPAYRAGLNADDEVVAIDGLRVTSGEVAARLKKHRPGDVVKVTYFRREELRDVELTLGGRESGTWKLRRVDAPTDGQRAQYKAWLGQEWPK